MAKRTINRDDEPKGKCMQKLKNKLSVKLIAGFAAVLGILAVVSIYSFVFLKGIDSGVDKIANFNMNQLINAENEAIAALEALSYQNNYLLTNADEDKNNAIAAIE